MIFSSEEALSASAGLIIQAAAIARASELLEGTNALRLRGTFFQSSKRHSIAEVYSWMGERIFRRAFRMSFDSFCKPIARTRRPGACALPLIPLFGAPKWHPSKERGGGLSLRGPFGQDIRINR
jgi:hypothetical protein